MDRELRPRLCFLTKGERGYGFHLHGERSKGGQFIRKVDPGSSADLGGLRAGDRVVEVNGRNVESRTHHQIVDLIREVSHRTRLLVVDRETDNYLKSHNLACTESMAIEMGTLSPRPSPSPTPSASPIPRENSPLLIKPHHALMSRLASVGSPASMITQSKLKRSSVTSSTTTDTELPVEPSPEPTDECLPRLCHLLKGEQGFGFNLQSEKNKQGQFVRLVDPCSPADLAGVRAGDRILEVNGVATEGMMHSEVVSLIRTGGEELHLLLVNPEMDELLHRLGNTSTRSHVKEDYVDATAAGIGQQTPSPSTQLPALDPPIINVTLSNSPITNFPPKPRTNGSLASQSSRSSTTQSEISSSDMSFQVPDEDERRVSDPFWDSGLRLSPTAAEAKIKVLGTRHKKRAPLMDWSKKQEIFSNF